MAQILLEDYLASEFKFGFELEAILQDRYYPLDDIEYKIDDDENNDEIDRGIEEQLAKLFNFNKDEIIIKSDGSVKSNSYLYWKEEMIDFIESQLEDEEYDSEMIHNNRKRAEEIFDNEYDYYILQYQDYMSNVGSDYSFEWASPTMQFTPQNIQKCINGLKNMHHEGIYTNTSCGFHTHISFPNISDQDAIWVLCQLANDDKMKESILKFKGIEFYDNDYASKKWLDELSKSLKDEDYKNLKKWFNTEKYRNIRLHPQGTLEWRGPRNFMNHNNVSKIESYFYLLYNFVRWISKAITKSEINGISKDNFFQMVFGQKYKEEGLINKFNSKNKIKKLSEKIQDVIDNNKYSFLINILHNQKLLYVFREAVRTNSKYDSKIALYYMGCMNYAYEHNKKDEALSIYSLLMEKLHPSHIPEKEILTENSLKCLLEDLFELDKIDALSIVKSIFDSDKNGELNKKDYLPIALEVLKSSNLSPADWNNLIYDAPYILMYVYDIMPDNVLGIAVITKLITRAIDEITSGEIADDSLSWQNILIIAKNNESFKKQILNYIQDCIDMKGGKYLHLYQNMKEKIMEL